MSNFPPFRAAPPKGETATKAERLSEPAPEPVAAIMKNLGNEIDQILNGEKSHDPIDEPFTEAQHVEHVRCCAKCFSTEVVDAVKIGDAIYIKVS
jgi:hypothetical protein